MKPLRTIFAITVAAFITATLSVSADDDNNISKKPSENAQIWVRVNANGTKPVYYEFITVNDRTGKVPKPVSGSAESTGGNKKIHFKTGDFGPDGNTEYVKEFRNEFLIEERGTYKMTATLHWKYDGDTQEQPPQTAEKGAVVWTSTIPSQKQQWQIALSTPDSSLTGLGTVIEADQFWTIPNEVIVLDRAPQGTDKCADNEVASPVVNGVRTIVKKHMKLKNLVGATGGEYSGAMENVRYAIKQGKIKLKGRLLLNGVVTGGDVILSISDNKDGSNVSNIYAKGTETTTKLPTYSAECYVHFDFQWKD